MCLPLPTKLLTASFSNSSVAPTTANPARERWKTVTNRQAWERHGEAEAAEASSADLSNHVWCDSTALVGALLDWRVQMSTTKQNS